MRKGPLSLLVAAAALLACEGLVSVTTGRSLLRRVPQLWGGAPGGDLMDELTLGERERAAASSAGINRLHEDPLVGYALRTHADLAILDGGIRSDELGLRARPTGPEPEGALRIAVLGASIPFGFGVDDDETLAHQLELVLAEARGPTARPVACRTVASGRWNHRNAVHFLLDHWDELSPDLVLYMPFANDLNDTDVVDEAAHRHAWPDPASPEAWTPINTDQTRRILRKVEDAVALGAGLAWVDLGPEALVSDISAESSRRYDENADSIALLASHVARHGGRVVFLQYAQDEHAWHLLRRMSERELELPVVPLFSKVPESFTLGIDPHPNAASQRVMALWTARALLDLGLVDRGAGLPLPSVPSEYGERRAQPRTPEEWVALSDEERASALTLLQPEVDFTTGRGAAQIYGGVGTSGLASTGLLVMLRPAAGRVEVELAPIAPREDLYPLRVDVEIDGRLAGEIVVPPASGPGGGVVSRAFPLPAGRDPEHVVEVRLKPERWVVVRSGDSAVLGSFRPLRIACVSAGR